MAPVSTYVDRPELRQQLEAHLHDRIDTAHQKTQIAIVQGIGGVGKTQLVLDYIQRHRQDYSGVFWIEANRPEAIERDFVQIQALLYNIQQEARQGHAQLQHAISAVKQWFYVRGKRWMFVFDNADSVRDHNDPCYIDLRHFLPDSPDIHVIVTTRDRLTSEMSELPAIEVDEMRPEQAIALFQRQAKISTTTPRQEEEIGCIVRILGHLALAITLAASYVALTPRLRGNLACFLPEYQQRRKQILSQRPTWLVHQYGHSVLTTWETTFAAMEGQDPGACELLQLLSFFNHDDIPSTFPTSIVQEEVPTWKSVLFPSKQIDEYDIEGYLRTLASFSFIKYRAGQNSYSMHSLIQAWAYDRLTLSQQRHYSYVGLLVLQSILNSASTATPATMGRLVPHVVSSCQKAIEIFGSAPAEHGYIIKLLRSLAFCLSKCGYSEEIFVAEMPIMVPRG